MLARCSPLASSVARQGDSPSGAVPAQGSLNPQPRVVTFTTRVIEKGGPQEPDSDGPPGVTIGFTPQQIDSFKQSSVAQLSFGDSVISSVTAVFVLNITRQEILNAGLMDQPVATLDPRADGTWVLKFSDELKTEQLALIRDHLAAIDLKLTQPH